MLPEEITGMIREIGRSHPIVVRELRMNRDGRNIAFEASASAFQGQKTAPSWVIVLLRDITEIEHLKREMERKERLARPWGSWRPAWRTRSGTP